MTHITVSCALVVRPFPGGNLGRRLPVLRASGIVGLVGKGARNLRRSGVAEEVIMKIGGWKTASVFKRYSIVGGDDIREAMTKMQQREQPVESARLSSTAVLLQSPETAPVAGKAQIN